MAREHTLPEPKLKVIPHTPPNQSPYQVSTFYTLWNQKNNPDKILKLMVTMTRSKFKSRSHHDVAHLQSQSMSLPSINFQISPRQDLIGQGHYGKVKDQIKVTP